MSNYGLTEDFWASLFALFCSVGTPHKKWSQHLQLADTANRSCWYMAVPANEQASSSEFRNIICLVIVIFVSLQLQRTAGQPAELHPGPYMWCSHMLTCTSDQIKVSKWASQYRASTARDVVPMSWAGENSPLKQPNGCLIPFFYVHNASHLLDASTRRALLLPWTWIG